MTVKCASANRKKSSVSSRRPSAKKRAPVKRKPLAKKKVAKKKTKTRISKSTVAKRKTTTVKKKAGTGKKVLKKGKTVVKKKSSGARMVMRKTSRKKASSKYKAPAEYMDKEQSDLFRTLLLDWKADLTEEVDRTVDHMQADATNFADPSDRATQEEEFSLELRTRDRERRLIKKINMAITQIDNKEYGYCELCGSEIGVERLRARPTANLCIDCKTLQEYQERKS